ncbi:type II secretion system F family protein [Candidatus Nitrospira nitrificans]|uniref:General secretion pathway protein F n=1 Tax=Candidatus Nitrospira nitrificans TaxID=1742973 RepID=A0A0S4LDS0_9BACT|nr:type II secretion system F family protein [Candidatus Nitrospira nitrificans]CUS33266.1 General secretion pathway protein F [Candidatus Nitrospira nitrificans]
MAVFAYRVARSDGSTLHGHVEGDNESAVRARLESQGLLVFNLHARGITSVKTELPWSWGKLPLEQFLVFNQELMALVKSGLPILRIWDLLIERAGHAGFQRTLRDVREDIRGGASASEALAKHPRYFPDLYVATVKAGEQSGNLPEVLQRYVAYLKLMVGLRQKVKKAISYPIVLICIGLAVVGFLLTYVMPTFVSVYGDSVQTLPWATQVLLDVVTHAESWLLPAAVVLIGLMLGMHTYYATSAGQLTIDRLVLKLPLVGQIAVKHNTVQLTRTLGTILAGGTPLVDALQGARGAIANRWISQEMIGAVNEIREGATLAAALDRPGVLPRLAIEMLSVGEETGSLDTMLRDVSEFYEADLDTRLIQLTTWIEPALLLVMGILVGGIVIVMYLPVFQMAGTVGG